MPFNRPSPSTPAAAPAAGAAQPARAATTHAPAAASARALPPASVPIRSAFAGVENAQVSRRGSYINDGQYVLQVQKVSYKQGRNKDMVIIETKVHTSSFDPADQTTHSCNKEGSDVSLYINRNDSFLGNLKEFIIAASGFDANGQPRALDDVVTEEECADVISDANPVGGAFIYVKARTVKTKATGSDFTAISYFPVPLDANKQPDLTQLG